MSNQLRTVTIPSDIVCFLQAVAGYQPDSKTPFQRQFDSALGILLALYSPLGPASAGRLRQIVRESDEKRFDASDSEPNLDNN